MSEYAIVDMMDGNVVLVYTRMEKRQKVYPLPLNYCTGQGTNRFQIYCEKAEPCEDMEFI